MIRATEQRGRADNRREHRVLAHREPPDRFVEISLRRVGDAIGPPAEVDRIQIGRKDVVLAPLPGHLRRDDQLFHLARDTALRAEHRVLDVLLRNRRPAARLRVPREIVARRPQETGRRKARIAIEIAVLRSQRRLLQLTGDIRQLHIGRAGLRRHNPADHGDAVRVVQRRHLVGPHRLRRGHIHAPIIQSRRSRRRHDQRRQNRQGVVPAAPAVDRRLLLRRRRWSDRPRRFGPDRLGARQRNSRGDALPVGESSLGIIIWHRSPPSDTTSSSGLVRIQAFEFDDSPQRGHFTPVR